MLCGEVSASFSTAECNLRSMNTKCFAFWMSNQLETFSFCVWVEFQGLVLLVITENGRSSGLEKAF